MTSPSLRRRTVMIGSVVGGAGLLAACSTSTVSNPSTGAATASGPLGATADVPVGGAALYPDQAVIVTQATAGEFAAFSDVCPHQGCAVSQIEGAELVCPCHSSRFDLEGAVLSGPAQSGLTSVPVSVEGDQLTLG